MNYDEDDETMQESDYNPLLELIQNKDDEINDLKNEIADLEHKIEKLQVDYELAQDKGAELYDIISELRAVADRAL